MKRTKNKQKPLSLYFKIALFSFLSLCVISILLIGNLFFNKKGNVQEIDIPSFVGKSQDEICDIDKVITLKDYVYSDAPKGNVIYQSHIGKKKISGDEVYTLNITVSLGSKTVIVPNLSGMSIKDAENKLNSLGVVADIEYVHGNYDSEVVLYHIPKKDKEIKTDDRITLYVSSKKKNESVKIPEFEGMDINDAVTLANQKGICVGDISYIYTEDLPRGCVVTQSIPSGALVDSKSKISFKVAENINYNTKDKKESRVKLWMDRKREE